MYFSDMLANIYDLNQKANKISLYCSVEWNLEIWI